jgi:hypothetical protein
MKLENSYIVGTILILTYAFGLIMNGNGRRIT